MKHIFISGLAAVAGLVLSAAVAGAPAEAAETLVGSNVDSRVLLGFAAPDDAVQGWLPEGFTPMTLPKGALAGANVLLLMIDGHLDMGPDGAALVPATSRQAVLASFGIPEGGPPRLFITRTYGTRTDHDPYGVARPAEIGRNSGLVGQSGEDPLRSEEWDIQPEAGGGITLRYTHTSGIAVWSEGELTAFSATSPEFYRIYRYRQLDDIAMSDGLGRALDGTVEIKVDVPELAGLFDGSERLVAIVSRPIYQRQTFLP